jgi:hypothetical protein
VSEVEELRRLLGWVYHRTRFGCFSLKRSERDKALSDVNFHTSHYGSHWSSPSNPTQSGRIWSGESP